MSRILVVEDSLTQARELQYILEFEGFTVEVAPDGQRGFDLFVASAFDLVITDVLMPGLSGYNLCRKIKDDPDRRQTPVILLTTLNDPSDIVQGIVCGADNFIPKPYDPEHLIARIRSLFANKALRAHSKPTNGVEVAFLGKTLTIASEKEQILDLLLSTCEEVVRANQELRSSREDLRAAKARLEEQNIQLQVRDGERTQELVRSNEALEEEVAARKEADETLRQAERKYRDIFESAVDGIFQTTSEGRYLSANPALARMYGYDSPEELMREVGSIARQVYVDPDRRAEFVREIDLHGHVGAFESQMRRKDGGLIWISENSRAVRDARGNLLYYEGFQRDVTERKALEEQVRQSQKMEAVGRLAGGVAHDFNNLLCVINGYTEMLLSQLPADAAWRETLEEIGRAGERAAGLTRQLLAFSRKQVAQPRVLDLNVVVAEAGKMLRRLIGEDVELTTVLDVNLARVKADPGQVEQVLLNLCVNARDAMPRGGKLTIETANVELDGALGQRHFEAKVGPYVLLAVSDTGCGMTPEVQTRIFEPFFTTKGPGRGTGLGLSTVYGIVKQEGGEIGVYSEPGRGTTFKIYLPRVDGVSQAGVEVRSSTPAQARGDETVLLAEDESGVRALARTVLRMHGYTVLEACDGAEALCVANKHVGPIHLLITDVVMPEVSGRELAEGLAARRPGVRVLYSSGYTDDAVVRHGVLAEGAAFLQKPYRGDDLARKVRQVLDSPR